MGTSGRARRSRPTGLTLCLWRGNTQGGVRYGFSRAALLCCHCQPHHFMPPDQEPPVASLCEHRSQRTAACRISWASAVTDRRYKQLMPADETHVASLYERRSQRTAACHISSAPTAADRRCKHLIGIGAPHFPALPSASQWLFQEPTAKNKVLAPDSGPPERSKFKNPAGTENIFRNLVGFLPAHPLFCLESVFPDSP